ncbi:protein of unknown function DUF547 [Cellulophaga algicola DSM 14237]|uniref:DUF547 domain-containing protein n=1 Tax=Cellulophaga algicola (strain DSM 14237 / IC166 / ACAM 630) TaxID=688270 RepID=E6X4H2_CELAD|nr:DUF547 domain-containing protein [Cellulophaga algicola]ADV48272.1 protein of unknown function DUF547 [Cellulophaga algicola DSM 14237]
MKKSVFIVFFLIGINLVFSQKTTEFMYKSDAFFKMYVVNGKLRYEAIKNNKEDLLVLKNMISTLSVSKSNTLEYQAFWINAYNISVIDGVVANYPLKSPLDVGGFFDKITYTISGKNITLNDIENKKLRAEFPKEARFHFVLVCAGLGCPPIINGAYMPSKLNSQLTQQTKKALNNPSFIVVEKDKVKISQLFEWYKKDFTQNNTSLIDFINTYKTEKLPENAKMSYYPYDWNLNDIK